MVDGLVFFAILVLLALGYVVGVVTTLFAVYIYRDELFECMERILLVPPAELDYELSEGLTT